jgi:hypothetical protein
MFEKMHWKPQPLLAMIAALSLTACTTLAPQTPEAAVEKRVEQYWSARIQGRLDGAYALINPAYRSVRSVDQYRAQFGSGSVKTAEVVNVTCAPQRCTVKMKLVAGVALPMINLRELVTHVDEVWLLEDGSWWRHEEL